MGESNFQVKNVLNSKFGGNKMLLYVLFRFYGLKMSKTKNVGKQNTNDYQLLSVGEEVRVTHTLLYMSHVYKIYVQVKFFYV